MNTETLRAFCMALPGVTEDIKWEAHLCFSIGAKMFVMCDIDGPLTASLKVNPEDFEFLTGRLGVKPSPYLARHHWLKIENAGALSDAEWEQYVRQSYGLVKAKLPKKLQRELENV